MKIVLNALQYKPNSSGIGKMIFHLYSALLDCCSPQDDVLVLLSKDSPPIQCDFPYVTIERLPLRKEESLRRNFFELFLLGGRYAHNAVYVSLDSKLPLRLPRSCRCVLLVTDMAVFRMPQVYQLTRAVYWRLLFRRSVRRADRLTTISAFTQSEISSLLHIPSAAIGIIPCASVDARERITEAAVLKRIGKKYKLPARYILFVGNFNPRKNLEQLLQAYQVYCDRQGKNDLVIAGELGWKFDADAALKGLDCRPRIHFIGYVQEGDLAAVYSLADTFAFPTLYEGFGIPLIEAQSCGVPVLTSNTSALPEVGGELGALYVEPHNVDEMAEGLQRLETDIALRERLIRNGYANCSRYSWKASARKLYAEIQNCGKPRPARVVSGV